MEERLARAMQALRGLAVGDALGGYFEFARGAVPARIRQRAVPQPQWHWTDDTQMAAGVVYVLRLHGGIDQDALAAVFAERYERSRGYGPATRAMLRRIRDGRAWRAEAPSLYGGTGSYGNGAAMRVAPLGAFWADDLARVAAEAAATAEVTHAHPEARAGAVAVALAAAHAWRTQAAPPATPAALLELVLPGVPASAVRDGLLAASALPPTTPVATAAAVLGNGATIACQDTVPFALWCAGCHLADYPAALWLTLEGLGDCDTTGAIVGGIVASGSASVPPEWLAACEPLPSWVLGAA